MSERLFLTGDLHGQLNDAFRRFNRNSSQVTCIIAGDAGLEYGYRRFYGANNDNRRLKYELTEFKNVRWLIVRGNHDNRIWKHRGARGWSVVKDDNGSEMIVEDEFPSIFYFSDGGGIYDVFGCKFLIIPGAWSIDGKYRRRNELPYEPDELLTKAEENRLLDLIDEDRKKDADREFQFDFIISHTYPMGIESKVSKFFMAGTPEEEINHSTEKFLQAVSDMTTFRHWYFGHLHGDKVIDDKHTLMYHDLYEIPLPLDK